MRQKRGRRRSARKTSGAEKALPRRPGLFAFDSIEQSYRQRRLKVFDRPFFKKVVGSWGKAPSRHSQMAKPFCLPKIRTGTSTVRWTVEVWETQLGGLPMNLHRKFIKAKTATHGFNLNDKSFSYGFVLLMIENHQFRCAKPAQEPPKGGVRRL